MRGVAVAVTDCGDDGVRAGFDKGDGHGVRSDGVVLLGAVGRTCVDGSMSTKDSKNKNEVSGYTDCVRITVMILIQPTGPFENTPGQVGNNQISSF